MPRILRRFRIRCDSSTRHDTGQSTAVIDLPFISFPAILLFIQQYAIENRPEKQSDFTFESLICYAILVQPTLLIAVSSFIFPLLS